MNRITQAIAAFLAPLLAPLREWFLAREPRERWLLIVGAIVVVVGGWYNLIQQPMQSEVARYAERNQNDQATLEWMRGAALQIRAQGGPSTSASSQGSLLSLADGSLRRLGLGSALQRIQPDDQNNVKIWLDNANFDTLLRWFAQMENQGLQITVAGITPIPGQETANGNINARITLTRPS
ncbi:MAG: type II secretion system protein M [Gammaproteobacteria bacterium]|nr:type II secretion system protein M [Gammaproteobacteria bacterium]